MSSFSKTVSWYQDIGKRPTGALKQYEDEIDSCISEILEMGTIFRLDEELIQNKIKDKQFKESQVMEEQVKVNLLP